MARCWRGAAPARGADIRLPFTSGPIYTQQVTRTFVRAHESAWQLGVGADLGSWAPGLTAYFDVTSGKDAINASSGAMVADEIEYDVGATWTLKQKGAYLDGLRHAHPPRLGDRPDQRR